MKKKARPKKRNPNDLTMRNIRALNKKLDGLYQLMDLLDLQNLDLARRITDLEKRK